jgi:hypothetical protein
MKIIDSLIVETLSIARELDEISQGIKREFMGIGADKCAAAIQFMANKYRYVSNELRKI